MDAREIEQRLLQALGAPAPVLSSFLAHAPITVQVLAADGRSVVVNDAFRALFGGVPRADFDVFTDPAAKAHGLDEMVRRAFRGETVSMPPVCSTRAIRRTQASSPRTAPSRSRRTSSRSTASAAPSPS